MSSIIHTGYGVGCTVIPPYSYAQMLLGATIQAVFLGIGPHLVEGCVHFVPTLILANHDAHVVFPKGFARCPAKLRRDSSLMKYVHSTPVTFSPMSCRLVFVRGSSQSVPANFGGGGSSCFHALSVTSLVTVSVDSGSSVFCRFAGTSSGMTHLARAAFSCAIASASVYRDWAKCFMALHSEFRRKQNCSNKAHIHLRTCVNNH